MSHVEVRWTTFSAVVLRKCLIGDEARSLIRQLVDALAPAIIRLELKTIREAAPQIRIESVVVGIHVRRGEKHLEERRVVCRQKVLIHKPDQFMTCAPLVPDRARELPGQLLLYLERVRVHVRIRQLLWRAPDLN